MPEFCERLEMALAMRDMSPAELSRRTGIGEGAISQYRKGGYKASQRNLDKISKALMVSIPFLMGISDEYTFGNSGVPLKEKNSPAPAEPETRENELRVRAFLEFLSEFGFIREGQKLTPNQIVIVKAVLEILQATLTETELDYKIDNVASP